MWTKRSTYEMLIEYIENNQESFYLLAFSYMKNKEDALDMVQSSIYKALTKYQSLRNPAYMKTWFYRILVNTSLEALRKRKRETILPPEEIPEGFSLPEEPNAEELYAALNHLAEDTKTIIILRFFEDLKLKEIAEILQEKESTVKNKLYRGLNKLKIQLEESNYHESNE